MWFIMLFLWENDSKFGEVRRSYFWNATDGGWDPSFATPYPSRVDAEMIAVFRAASAYIGGVRVVELQTVTDYFDGVIHADMDV